MSDISNKFKGLKREKHLAKALTAKFLFSAGLGGKFSFDVRGVRLKFFPSEMTYEAWKRPEDYRTVDQAFLEKVLEPGGLVVDVGANIGMIAMRAAKLVGSGGHVIAVEPNPRIAGYCQKNIELNGFKNISLFQTALGAEVGSVAFHCDDRDDCSGVITEGGIRVPLTTLDRLLEKESNRPINLLKIDVEGFELSVLEGASETLKRAQWLYIEVEAKNYEKYGRDTQDVMRILERNGFDAFFCDDAGKWQPINGTLPEDINLIGKKRALQTA